ncbi:MAG: SUF system NifU family Fe-S cluster assembly protein [Actinobacteria bacterium]|jgi:nitrogen fixation protein NifU and related proteins|nr:SUF system NifU family Fe-S cluster assembly protein [Actinomycetota bacterium]NBP90934.1 SUF system NifU family Fe-S cluster assembly protein [Actinomycetota bacterium]
MNLEKMYQEIILDHYKHPQFKNLAPMVSGGVEVHHINPTCGDEVTLRAQVVDGVIESVTWDGLGCSISQASTSVMAGLAQGATVENALELTAQFLLLMQGKGVSTDADEILEDGIAFAGVAQYPARVKCALLGWMALKDAITREPGEINE